MRRISTLFLAAILLAGAAGCAKKQTYKVPPRVDLKNFELIGVIEFDSSSAGELAPMATRRFTDLARQDQGLVRIVEFGPTQVGSNPASLKAFGGEHGLQTILTGKLTVSDVKPDLSIAASLRSGSLTAKVDATLSVQLIEVASGASIWSRSASATRNVAQVSLFSGGDYTFDADDPDEAYGELVDTLVSQVSRDFRVTWERR